MKEIYYCPTCKKQVEEIAACGASNYFCNHCKKLVSSRSVWTKEQLEEKVEQEQSSL